eukprot:g1421.t1
MDLRKTLQNVKLPRDPLFRLLVINGLAGTAIAALVLAGIFAANIGNLRVLVLAAEDPVLPVLMLAFGLVITLGSVVIGSAIMLLGEKGRDGGGRGKGRLIDLGGDWSLTFEGTVEMMRPLVEDAVELKQLAEGAYSEVSQLDWQEASDEAVTLFVVTMRLPTLLFDRLGEKLDEVGRDLNRNKRAEAEGNGSLGIAVRASHLVEVPTETRLAGAPAIHPDI